MISMEDLLKWTQEDVRSFKGMRRSDDQIVGDEIFIRDPITGETVRRKVTEAHAMEMNRECLDSEWLEDWILNLDLGTYGDKIRPVLLKLLRVTQVVGNVILNIGRVILGWVLKLLDFARKTFPNTVTGLVVGFVVGLALSTIPVVGWLLSGIIVPLTTATGGLLGLVADTKKLISNAGFEIDLRQRFAGFTKSFAMA